MRYSVQLVLVNGAELIKSSALSRFKIEKWEEQGEELTCLQPKGVIGASKEGDV